MTLVGRTVRVVAAPIRRTGGAVRSSLPPVPLIAGRPYGRFGPAYALEYRVSPAVWIARPRQL